MAAGFDPDSFWSKSPRLIQLCFDGKAEQLLRERDGRAWLAWHIAALSRQETLPEFDKMMVRQSAAPKQSPDEIWAIFSTIAAAQSRMH